MKWTLALVALSFTATATAATNLHDTFDTENGGTAAENYNGLTSFQVPSGAVVTPDLIFGDECTGGAGGCINLKNGAHLQSRSLMDFSAGDLVKLSLDVRLADITSFTSFEIGFEMPSETQILNFRYGDGFVDDYGPATPADYNTTGIFIQGFIGPGGGYKTYSASFTAGNQGSLRAVFFDFGYGSGLLVDNVKISIGAPPVPEPATWGLMIGGFGLIGYRMRRPFSQRTGPGRSLAALQSL